MLQVESRVPSECLQQRHLRFRAELAFIRVGERNKVIKGVDDHLMLKRGAAHGLLLLPKA